MTDPEIEAILAIKARERAGQIWWWFLGWATVFSVIRILLAIDGTLPLPDPPLISVAVVFLMATVITIPTWLLHTFIWLTIQVRNLKKQGRERR